MTSMETGLSNSSKRSLQICLRSTKRNLKKNPGRGDGSSKKFRRLSGFAA